MKTTDKPSLQEFQIEGVKHIAPAEALKLIEQKKAILIDVREQNEVMLETIPLENVLYHPMSVIMDRLPYIAKDQNIILGCPGGVRSAKVANLLNLNGYQNVANLDGGFKTWKEKAFPWKHHVSIVMESGCGCGCSTTKSDGENGECC